MSWAVILPLQTWYQESQDIDGTEFTEGCEKQRRRFVGQKRKAKDSAREEKGELATTVMGKAEVLDEFFASVFTGNRASHVSHVPETPGRVGRVKSLPL